ncbi:MAG: hypothetical protein ACOH12_02540 [Parvibaculaceae bacterium]
MSEVTVVFGHGAIGHLVGDLLFSRFMKEVADVGFTWNRPYRIDASKFKNRFWSDVTPFETGAVATARSFLAATGNA